MDDSLIPYGTMIVVGMVLGALFFGGLWATVRKLPTSKRPGLLVVSSMILRTAIVCWGVWYFSNGDGGSMAACLLGFIAIRLLSTHGRQPVGAACRAALSPPSEPSVETGFEKVITESLKLCC